MREFMSLTTINPHHADLVPLKVAELVGQDALQISATYVIGVYTLAPIPEGGTFTTHERGNIIPVQANYDVIRDYNIKLYLFGEHQAAEALSAICNNTPDKGVFILK